MRARVGTQQQPPQRPPITVALAWRRYLVATRTAPPGEYERVEDRAWQRLQHELAFLEARVTAPGSPV